MLDWKKEIYSDPLKEFVKVGLKVRLKDCVMAPSMEVEKVDLLLG